MQAPHAGTKHIIKPLKLEMPAPNPTHTLQKQNTSLKSPDTGPKRLDTGPKHYTQAPNPITQALNVKQNPRNY